MFTDAFVIRQSAGDALERHSRPLYDYVTLVNIYQGCANLAGPDAPLNPIGPGERITFDGSEVFIPE